jgi:DnaJ-class molecular chaperone
MITHTSARTYFAPHTNVKVTVDTKEVEVGTDWEYSYSITVDDIGCSKCGGSGGSSTLTTCGTCHGQGQVTQTTTCSNCRGTGQITVDNQIACPVCNGNGYVTNWGTVSIGVVMTLVGIGAVIGAGLFVMKKKK